MGKTHWFYERREGDPEIRPLTVRALMRLHPLTLEDTELVMDAMRLMKEKDVRHIPIVSKGEGTLVGLITETDILNNVLHGRKMTTEEEYHATLDVMLQLKEIMVKDVMTLSPDASVAEAVALFLNHKFRCVPIVDNARKVVGILTETDLMKLLNHIVEQ
jgi:CBS domain-containing membrane protein